MSLSKMQKGEGDSLRASFKEGLTKLLQISTRQQANKDLKNIIVQNKTTINLRLWLSVLSENRSRHPESEINIIAFIVQQYGRGLLDPLDKIPSLEKTVFRVTELLIKLYFKEQNINVSIALQKVWNELYLSAVCDEEPAVKKRLLYDCLEAILNGGADRLSQCTAQVVMEGILQTSLNSQDFQFFKETAKRTLVLFLKTTISHPAVLTCLQTVLGYFSIINLLPLLDNIISKILSYIPTAPSNSQGYKMKAEASNCLALIGEQLDQNGVAIQQKVIKVLQNLATDKIWAVQVTGRKALNIWKAKVKEWSKQYNSKQEQFFPSAHQFYQAEEHEDYIQPKRRPMTAQNFRPKQEINKQERSTYEPRMADLSQGGFLHKNTGIGGGNTAQSAQFYYERQKPQETYSRKMEQIKKSIYKPKQDYTQYDQTIPWNQGQNLPVPEQTKIKPPPRFETKSSFQVQNNLTEDEEQYMQGWEKVMQLFQAGKKQESAKAILDLDDDMYFLRFMLKYGKGILGQLTRPTAAKILKKMLGINKTHFMQQVLLKMVGETAKSSTGHLLTNQQIMSIEEALKKCQKISGLQKPVCKVKQALDRSLQN